MLKPFRFGVTKASTILTIQAGLFLLASATLASAQVSSVNLSDVELLGGNYYWQMQELNSSSAGNMEWLQPDDLLYQFRLEVGLPQPAGAIDLEGRWEGDDSEYGFVRGHNAGHWLTAASRSCALTGDTTYLNRVNDMVAGLGLVQDAFTLNGESGYLSAFPKPFYETHHKRYSVYWKLNAPAGTHTWRGGGMDLIQDETNWDVATAEDDSIVSDANLRTTVDNN